MVIILLGCEFEEELRYLDPAIHNYRIYLSEGRIIVLESIYKDSVSGRTEYFFEDSIVTKIHTSTSSDEIIKIIYKMGQNGYASSSIKIPEKYTIFAGVDTIYRTRAHYIYDDENHLIEKAYEIIHEGEIIIEPAHRYRYENGNLVFDAPVGRFGVMPGPVSGAYYNSYVPSEIHSKLDIHGLTNGILGVTSKNLIKHADYFMKGSPPLSNSGIGDFEYKLDNRGYVIQKVEYRRSLTRHGWGNSIWPVITNYEIHENNYRIEEDRQPVDRVDGQTRDENIVAGGQGFGEHFPENQDQKSHHAGGQSHRIVREQVDGNGGRQGRRADVDDIIADEDGGEQAVGVSLHLFNEGIGSVFLFCNVSGPGITDGKEGRFR